MLKKSFELTGVELNWAVAQARGLLVNGEMPSGYDPVNDTLTAAPFLDEYHPELMPLDDGNGNITYSCVASFDYTNTVFGSTWREAICRAIVTVVSGHDIDVPDDLTNP